MLHGAAPRRGERWALGAQAEGCALEGRITLSWGKQSEEEERGDGQETDAGMLDLEGVG